jgi:hypothetical protein
MPEERLVSIRPRTILLVVGVLLGVAMALWVVWVARQVITWVLPRSRSPARSRS